MSERETNVIYNDEVFCLLRKHFREREGGSWRILGQIVKSFNSTELSWQELKRSGLSS